MDTREFVLPSPADVPRAAKVLAVVAYCAVLIAAPAAFHFFEPHPPQLLLQLLLGALWGAPLAVIVLALGLVHRDAARRGMNATLWTLVAALLIPGAIGFVIYFLSRKPIRADCPQCSAVVRETANYCPNCRFALKPTCPTCGRPTHHDDSFCESCGAKLSLASSPADVIDALPGSD